MTPLRTWAVMRQLWVSLGAQTQEKAEHQQLKEQIRGQYSFANIIGQSKKMKDLFELIESVAASDANILIQGEHGTGKELVADAVHRQEAYGGHGVVERDGFQYGLEILEQLRGQSALDVEDANAF